MLRTRSFLFIAIAALVARFALVGHRQRALWQSPPLLNEACQELASAISATSKIHNVGSANYMEAISHWAKSSVQNAACSFEPGTPEDVGVALRILGQRRTPFAVKGGGHSTNPGSSSTDGVQISMARFSEVVYDAGAQTATVGAGLVWDDVYAALEPYGVNVVGGRVSGVGVAGFTLGGGYSWLTSQHGLTIDTVQAFELVTPDGAVTNVTETSSPDLFFALKGGMNNFGIVTRFTLKTFPQTQVWGGLIFYTSDVLDRVNQATANFAANNTDPKAAILTMYQYFLGQPGVAEIIFYDGPTPPPGIFDEFLRIPSLMRDVSTRSFSSLVKCSPVSMVSGKRGIFNTISVTDYPLSLLESVVNETMYWGTTLPRSVFYISYVIEPFLPTLLTHNSTPSAYPPDRTKGFFPLHIYYAWWWPETDQLIHDTIRASAKTLQMQAIDGGQFDTVDAALYPNYAIFDTPVSDIYGGNLPALQAIKTRVDPDNVMGLAGGFKL